MILALLACDRMVQGEVRAPDGAPIAGAKVQSRECAAVSASDGRWRTRCPKAPATFTITRPGFEAGVALEGGVTTLVPFPTVPGLYHRGEEGWSALPLTPLRRKEGQGRIAWCLEETEIPSLRAPIDFIDVHAAEWNAFRVDESGCAWQIVQGTGTFWEGHGEQLTVPARTAVSPGTDRIQWSLPAGRYAVVEWLDGAPAPAGGGLARAWAFDVP